LLHWQDGECNLPIIINDSEDRYKASVCEYRGGILMYCFICKLDEDEEYFDELYNCEEEKVSSDESIASLYEYDHEDNDQSKGDGNDLEMENNKNNTNVTYRGNDLQSPLVELVDESMVKMVKKEIMSQKCQNKETMDEMVTDGMVTIINDGNVTNESQYNIEADTTNETALNKTNKSTVRLEIIQLMTMEKKGVVVE